MSQIDELQARIMEALDRIGRGVERRAAAEGPGASGTFSVWVRERRKRKFHMIALKRP